MGTRFSSGWQSKTGAGHQRASPTMVFGIMAYAPCVDNAMNQLTTLFSDVCTQGNLVLFPTAWQLARANATDRQSIGRMVDTDAQGGGQSSPQGVQLPLPLGCKEYLAGAEHVSLQEPIKLTSVLLASIVDLCELLTQFPFLLCLIIHLILKKIKFLL
jgi:hypothetical protein